ncbi:hypothetical protein ACGWZA_002658, partial [Enterococcus hirae]
RANKRGFFKIAPHILENHRLLLRSCFLNAVYSFLEILEETKIELSLKKYSEPVLPIRRLKKKIDIK